MATQLILLERVDNLGEMGEIVSVKPGYARNYLLPQKKALRASKENIAYFEAKKTQLEADNAARRDSAAKDIKKIEGLNIAIIRQASEGGQLYGSVTTRDIAEAITAQTGVSVARTAVQLNQNFKLIGLFPLTIALHPEVKAEATINIARSEEEAALQKETGRAVTEEAPVEVETPTIEDDANLEAALEDTALEAEKEKAETEAVEAAEAEAKATEKAEKKAAKAAARAEVEAEAEEAEAETSEEEEAE